MHQAYCDNCGCKIDHTDHTEGRCALIVEIPDDMGALDPIIPRSDQVNNAATFDLCDCCARGIIKILMENRTNINTLHGVNCEDILPMGYRCSHV